MVTSSWPWLGTEQPELLDTWGNISPLHRRFCGGTFIKPHFWRCRVTQRIFGSFQKKQSSSFLLLHQTQKKKAGLGTLWNLYWAGHSVSLGRHTSLKSRALACYFVVCISMDRCQRKTVWLDKLLLSKLKQIFDFTHPIFTWKMPSVHWKASWLLTKKKHCLRALKGKTKGGAESPRCSSNDRV